MVHIKLLDSVCMTAGHKRQLTMIIRVGVASNPMVHNVAFFKLAIIIVL